MAVLTENTSTNQLLLPHNMEKAGINESGNIRSPLIRSFLPGVDENAKIAWFCRRPRVSFGQQGGRIHNFLSGTV
jgi:hypothetical protein